MRKTSRIGESGLPAAEQQDAEILLAAALAATLVAYQRQVNLGAAQAAPGAAASHSNWRLVSRLEQIRG